MRMLVVVAHPDDETLGAGGTMARYAAEGWEVYAMAMTDGVGARDVSQQADVKVRLAEWRGALKVLGAKAAGVLDYPDNQLDAIPMLKLAKRVEEKVRELEPRLVITHHAHDLNVDHRRVREAVEVACRPKNGAVNILAMEVLSVTELRPTFAPTYYVKITGGPALAKMHAMECYASEIDEQRSVGGIGNLASRRGDECGVDYAEAFEVVRWIHD